MRNLLSSIRQFLSELRRRNVYRVAVTYVVVGVFVIEAADLTLIRLGLPPWTVTLVIVLVGLGFPIALVMAWALEMTPEGVRVEETASEEEVSRPTSTTQDLWVGASVLVLLLLGAWWVWGNAGGGGAVDSAQSRGPEIGEHSIAVLPFEVSGSGAEAWRDGMVSTLSLNLDGAAGLRAIADRTVFAAWERQDSAEAGASTEDALAVARDVGARYAVVGSAVQLGEDLRFGAEVRRAATGKRLGKVEVRGSPESITALTDRLTREVLGVLLEKSEERVPSVDLASITTESLPALKAFLEGERHLRAGKYEAAARDFEAAVRQDSTFALAYSRLSKARAWVLRPKAARRALGRAYELSGQLPERERRIIRARYLRRVQSQSLAAANRFRRLSEAYPDDPTVWYELGEVLLHGWVPGGWPEADEAFQKAVRLDPGLAQYHHHLVQLAFAVHHDSTLAANRIRAHPVGGYKQAYRLALELVFGSPEKRKKALARLDSLSVSVGAALTLAGTFFSPQDRALQEKVLRRLLEGEETESSPYATLLVANGFERGQVKAATARLQEPARLQELGLAPLPGILPAPNCILSGEAGLSTPIPDSVLRARLDPSRIGQGASSHQLLCAGMYLIEKDREEELPALIGRLQEAGANQGAGEPEIQQVVDELRGYRALQDEDLRRAKELLGGHNESWYWGAIRRGDLYREMGELETAEGWYLAGWPHPVAHERLGQLHEKMVKPEKARAAYERFIEAWKDADPALQDRVEKARQRLRALSRTAP